MSNPDASAPPAQRPLGYVELILTPPEDGFHPVDALLAQHPALTRDQLRNIERQADGSISVLAQLGGDPTAAHSIFETADKLSDYRVSETTDTIHAYLHLKPTPTLEALLRIPEEYAVLPQLPLQYTDAGRLRVTVVGDLDALADAETAIPPGVTVTAEDSGLYNPATIRLLDDLTPRQRETLQAAVAHGYYQNPRDASLQEIAEAMNRTDGTVGDHLRTIEAYVMQEIVP